MWFGNNYNQQCRAILINFIENFLPLTHSLARLSIIFLFPIRVSKTSLGDEKSSSSEAAQIEDKQHKRK